MSKTIDTEFIHRTLRWMANAIIPDYNNHSLPCELQHKMDKFYSTLQSNFDWDKLNREDCIALGFLTYGAEEHEPYEVLFIPAWFYPIIPEGLWVADKDFNRFQFHRVNKPCTYEYSTLEFGILLKNPSYRPKQCTNKKGTTKYDNSRNRKKPNS